MTDKTNAWSFKKQTVEQYQFNGPFGAWAIITLDPRGIFQAVSDFGTFAYDGWGHHGRESFKHFLVEGLSRDYFLGKTARGERRFSLEKTKRRLREDVVGQRRDGDLTKEKAREAWDAIDWRDEDDATLFIERADDVREILFGNDYCAMSEACAEEWSGCAVRFYEEVFLGQLVPVLTAEITHTTAPEVR